MPPLLKQGSQGPDVIRLKHLLEAWAKTHPLQIPIADTPVFGKATVDAVKAFQRANHLDPDGKVGSDTWKALGVKPSQNPALPGHFVEQASGKSGAGRWGLQPWIACQVEAICDHFGLQVTAGFGGHPPHAEHSDHNWGGAVDLAGPMDAMVKCNLWADKHVADPHHPGGIFRWVGGPAKDSTGVEPGHQNHVHLSWYRHGPATSVFDTPEFK
jgi:putative peptidoglycan binding protein